MHKSFKSSNFLNAIDKYAKRRRSKITDEIKELYIKNGGSPHLDGYFNTEKRGHTVFGQVIDGMDVVNNISQVDVDESNKPAEPVVIKSISIEKYSNK